MQDVVERDRTAYAALVVKTSEERGTLGTWARDERLRHGWSVEDVVERLEEPMTAVYVRGVEAGTTTPGPVRLAAFARLYGSDPPEPERAPSAIDVLRLRLEALEERVQRLES